MPKPVAYACGICGTELRAEGGKSARGRAAECERLGKPPFKFKVGDQIHYVRLTLYTGGRIERDLTVTRCFYTRQTKMVGRGSHRPRKIAVHVPAYEFTYVRDGMRYTRWCVESTLVDFQRGPVKTFRGLFIL